MSDILYLKLDKNIGVTKTKVTIGDVASLWCRDKAMVNRLKTEKIFQVPAVKKGRFVLTALDVIEVIQGIYPSVQVESVGEPEFIIDYVQGKPQPVWMEVLKAIGVSVVTFFGSAYAVMAYNNDVGTLDIFQGVYEVFLGEGQSGNGILELTYSIGILAGIVVFYNHLGKHRFTNDPTPIEVEMRAYEEQLDDAIIKNSDRGQST